MALMKPLEVKIGADTTSFDKGIRNVQTGVKKAEAGIKSLSSGLSTLGKATLAIAGVTAGIAGIVKAMKDYVIVRNAVQRVNEIFGEHSDAIKSFANSALASFGMSESAALEYAAMYGNIFSSLTKSAAENAKVSAAMLKTTAIIASKTGRTVEDVSTRLYSGMMGNARAIDDLGVVVPTAAIKASKAFERMANGRPWEQLTYNEQVQIRTMAIMEQVTAKYGDTVTMITGYSLNRMREAFRDLTTYAGMLLTKALQPLINAMAKFAIAATQAMKSLAAFLGIKLEGDLQTDIKDLSKNESAFSENTKDTTKALKEQLGVLAGFDKLEVIGKPEVASTDGEAGAGAFDDIPELPKTEIEPPDTSWIDGFTKKIKDVVSALTDLFLPAIEAFKTAWNTIAAPFKAAWDSIKNTIMYIWDEIFVPFMNFVINDFIAPIVNEFVETFAPIFSDVLPAVFDEFAKSFQFAAELIKKIIDDIIKPIFLGIKTAVFDVLNSIKAAWNKYGAEIIKNFSEAMEKIRNIWNTLYEKYIKPIAANIGRAFSDLWNNHLKPFWDVFYEAVLALGAAVLVLYNKVILPFTNWLLQVFSPLIVTVWDLVVTSLTNAAGFIIDIFKNVVGTIKGFLEIIIGIFTGDFKRAFEGLSTVISHWVDYIIDLLLFPFNSIIKGINVLIRAANALGANIAEIPLMGKNEKTPTPAPTTNSTGKGGTQQRFARGVVVRQPTRALIGEAGKEAVIPLENNTGWAREVARAISGELSTRSGGGNGNGENVVVVNIGNEHLGTFIAKANARNSFRTNGKAVLV